MPTKEEAHSQISALVERFAEQLPSYKKSDYNETLTRRDFIDPFFKALGWDMNNSAGNAEAYREVIHEDKIKIGSATKAPDYSFRLPGGKRLFFVEAKKPSVYVKDEILPAYQVRRYAWSAKLPISILTDFEEFAVYDCKKKPNITDKASTSRIKYITYKDYLSQFDFIWDNFSKEKVLKGGFDKFVQSDSNKKGTSTVDKEFLVSLDEWRKELAQNIALRNIHLNEDEINYTVQQTIDRLIFLRIAEDRGVEEYGRLKTFLHGDAYYQNLFQYFKEADSKYNSGLFNFKKDTLSTGLTLDNKVIKNILNELYYPISPYEFSVLSVEILGSAYEQFLGKQIRLTAGHKAVIEEKPEVRKAGGVYYTPQYIVEYIVKNTVGKLTEGKTPEEIQKLKIVDPACGSGSFLIGAYEYLLNYHQEYYKPKFEELTQIAASNEYTSKQRTEAQKERNKLPLTPDGNLTTAVKKQILLNNIFGVDIDTQAVEVTKLSLMLKCMEGETKSSINAEMNFGERVLPTLDDNIKCGNSLIDVDFYDGQLDFEPGIEKKVKPFSWKKAFPKIFKQGGFDCVIGNPPYVRQELLHDFKNYFQKHYKVYHGVADLYSYFFEKGISLLNDNGLFGIIVANKWMRANYGEPLRKWLKHQPISEIIDFGDLPVFQNATTYPCIIIAGKDVPRTGVEPFTVTMKTLEFDRLEEHVKINKQTLHQQTLEDEGWNLGSEAEQQLLKKIQSAGIPLGEYVKGKIYRGVLTGLNEAFVIDEETRNCLIAEDKRSEEIIKPFLAGRDVKRYEIPRSNKYLIFTKRGIDIDNYPAIKKYLLQFKTGLMPKPKNFTGDWKGRKPGSYLWYEIQDAVDYYKEFEKDKIIYPNICKQPEFTFDENKWYTNQKCFIISVPDKYLLGILNSKLNYFLFQRYLPKLRGGFYEPSYVFFKNFPIKKIDENNKSEKSLHDEIVHLVETMLQLQKEKQQSTLPDKLDQLNTRIEYTDEKINKLVFELYGLGEEERKIVEGG
ncbi:MAG: Eco57I restriction-modification methylase domain-containing protein [Ginsengibacter sp.]